MILLLRICYFLSNAFHIIYMDLSDHFDACCLPFWFHVHNLCCGNCSDSSETANPVHMFGIPSLLPEGTANEVHPYTKTILIFTSTWPRRCISLCSSSLGKLIYILCSFLMLFATASRSSLSFSLAILLAFFVSCFACNFHITKYTHMCTCEYSQYFTLSFF